MGDLADPGELERTAGAIDGFAQRLGRQLDALSGDITAAVWQGNAANRGRASVSEQLNRLANRQRRRTLRPRSAALFGRHARHRHSLNAAVRCHGRCVTHSG